MDIEKHITGTEAELRIILSEEDLVQYDIESLQWHGLTFSEFVAKNTRDYVNYIDQCLAEDLGSAIWAESATGEVQDPLIKRPAIDTDTMIIRLTCYVLSEQAMEELNADQSREASILAQVIGRVVFDHTLTPPSLAWWL